MSQKAWPAFAKPPLTTGKPSSQDAMVMMMTMMQSTWGGEAGIFNDSAGKAIYSRQQASCLHIPQQAQRLACTLTRACSRDGWIRIIGVRVATRAASRRLAERTDGWARKTKQMFVGVAIRAASRRVAETTPAIGAQMIGPGRQNKCLGQERCKIGTKG
eukprot:1161005-Pelagomonas_calceolata.AAC.8